jgi:ABC-type dipeptide/oligopeptide/nickel transport system ATPase component
MIKLENSDFITKIYSFSQSTRRIISISGESGTGKTTLALQLIGTLLTKDLHREYSSRGIWIQASEHFPKKRLVSLFKNFPSKINYLLRNILVYPGNKPFSNYKQQSIFFDELGTRILPYNVKFIVIDNISHHLRFAVSLNSNIRGRIILLDRFFNSQLFPLIMRCLRENIVLILVHEVSFDPNLDRTQPFFNKLYSRIQAVNISLSKRFNSKFNEMEILSGEQLTPLKIKYEIKDCGISRL